MMPRPLLAATLVLAALAGCSDAPPSGELADLDYRATLDGTAAVQFTQERKPYEEQAGQDLPEGLECAPDDAPPELDDFKCVDPETAIAIHVMELPDPGSEQWEAFLTGTAPAHSLGTLTADGVMYNLDFTEAVDYSDDLGYDTIELRLGDFTYATAPAENGEQGFSLATGLDAVTATGTYRNKELTLNITGLPQNGTFTGHLYEPAGEDTVEVVSVEHFDVQNGEVVYEAERPLSKYVQFHIHAGDSKVQLFQASIE